MGRSSYMRGFASFIFLTGYLFILNANMRVEADDKPSAKQNTARMESNFVKKVYLGGQAEVELSRIAATKGASQDVRQFANMMVTSHTSANDKLRQAANKENLEIPTDLEPAQKAAKARLETLSGEQFDKEYARIMVSDHEKIISLMRDQMKNDDAPALKAFSQELLPEVEMHLREANELSKKTDTTRKTS